LLQPTVLEIAQGQWLAAAQSQQCLDALDMWIEREAQELGAVCRKGGEMLAVRRIIDEAAEVDPMRA
jgi:hypothetical protein